MVALGRNEATNTKSATPITRGSTVQKEMLANQLKNINKRSEIIKKYQNAIPELQSIYNEKYKMPASHTTFCRA